LGAARIAKIMLWAATGLACAIGTDAAETTSPPPTDVTFESYAVGDVYRGAV
jgi:hypothetical protein